MFLKRKIITSFTRITLSVSGMRGACKYEIICGGDEAQLSQYSVYYKNGRDECELELSARCKSAAITDLLNRCSVMSWDGFCGANPRGVRDGIMFSLNATVNGGVTLRAEGSENFPKRYREFTDGLNDLLSSEKSEVTP